MKSEITKNIKKILSIILCLSIITLLMPQGMAANIAVTIYTGERIVLTDRDNDTFYDIGDADELYAFAQIVNDGNKSINGELVADIIVNYDIFDAEGNLVSYTSDLSQWIPAGGVDVPYRGVFEGANHNISGLYCAGTDHEYVGLFGCVDTNSVVRNLTISDSYFSGNKTVGVIVGIVNSGLVENCFNEQATVESEKYAGGIAGWVRGGTIKKCGVNGTVLGNSYVGGITSHSAGEIVGCYNIGKVGSANYMGGILADNDGVVSSCYCAYTVVELGGIKNNLFYTNYGTVEDCCFISINNSEHPGSDYGTLSNVKCVESFEDGEACYLLNGDQSEIIWYQSLYTDSLPGYSGERVYNVQNCLGGSYSNKENAGEHKFYDGVCVLCEAYESAALNNGIYNIANKGQLLWFAQQYNSGNLGSSANAVLTNDIDLMGYTWTPIGTSSTKYKGVFDGQDHSVTNFNMTVTGKGDWGLFGYATGAGTVIKNFSISGDVTTELTSNVDVQYGVVGQADGTTEVRNVHSTVNITSNDSYQKKYFGGIVGRTGNITVDKCSFNGKISLSSNVLDCLGGIVGYVYNGKTATITDCGFYGVIESTYSSGSVGGILGYYNGENAKALNVSKCLSIGTLPEGRGALIGTLKNYGSTKAGTNNYYISSLNHSISNVTATAVTQAQLASGEVAYLLGEAWGQMSNTEGSLPIITDNELYKVVTVGKTGNYSVANIGDTNGDRIVDVTDYQTLVNMAVSGGHTQSGTSEYYDIVKYDLDGDGYVDALDASIMHLMISGHKTIGVYPVGDYYLDGVAFEKTDIVAIKEYIKNPEKLKTYQKYACDINNDGNVNEEDLTVLVAKYGNNINV